jgi:RNA polymerase sigma-70 factor (ECF subfamily)
LKSKQDIFSAELRQHQGIIIKVARMYADNPDDQSDLIQEISLQLWKSFDGFKGDSKFSTWLYRVALNTAITFLKKEKRRVDKGSLILGVEPQLEGSETDKNSQLFHFYKAVQELNQIEKALIFLFIEGLAHKDIALNLGLSEVNTRVKLNRTKQKLQEIIKKQGYEF